MGMLRMCVVTLLEIIDNGGGDNSTRHRKSHVPLMNYLANLIFAELYE